MPAPHRPDIPSLVLVSFRSSLPSTILVPTAAVRSKGTTQLSTEKSAHLVQECHRIAEDSLYTAQAHFEIATSKGRGVKIWLQLVPSVATAASGTVVAMGGPLWCGAIAALSGVVTGVGAYLGVDKETTSHTVAAKLFTKLRHEARALGETYSSGMSDRELLAEVRKLRDQYANYVESSPDTDEDAFAKAQKKIQEGRFKPDAFAASQAAKALPESASSSSKVDS